MWAEVRVANYRCFSEQRPATIVIADGETAIVGANNSGKSTLLKFFYEMRAYFTALAQNPGFLGVMLRVIRRAST